MTSHTIKTGITEMFGIKHPILLAGMNVAAGPELAAAVTNAGGLGVIGGVGYTPDFLRKQIKALKAGLKDPNAPFGVDLLLPKVRRECLCLNRSLSSIVRTSSSSHCRFFRTRTSHALLLLS